MSRGAVTLWLHEAVLRGGWSREALQCHCDPVGLSLRAACKLPLREADQPVPDLERGPQKGPLHLAIAATGLKLFCEGKWQMRQHGPQSSLRQTPLAMVSRTNGETMARLGATLHLAVVTPTGEILAPALTPSDHHDGPEMPGLLAPVKVRMAVVSADQTLPNIPQDRSCHEQARTARRYAIFRDRTPYVSRPC